MIKLKLPQEFRLSVISKIFYLVVATALVGLSVYGAIEGVFLRNFSTSLVPALLVLIAFLIFRSVTRR
ncbi:MAG TPA: hypothetical protein VFM79_00025, partial [Pelobium sp.]|nr:hypothetical protein [Pelobium sp.]